MRGVRNEPMTGQIVLHGKVVPTPSIDPTTS